MLIEAKSHLARLMATENLTIEERNVPTAFFDPQSRVLTIPILNGNLSPQLYDLLLGHEVGHALETPAEGWHDAVTDYKVDKSILNVCEDARIEKKIKRRFPGLKPSFIRGYYELMEMDFFSTKGKDLNELNFIDRVNLYTKGGAAQGITFNSEETLLLREVECTETWEEVVAVAKKISEFMKMQHEERKKIKIKIKADKKEKDEDEELTEEEKRLLEGIENGEYDVEVEIEEDGEPAKTAEIEQTEESTDELKSGAEKTDDKKVEDEKKAGTGAASSNQTNEEVMKSETDEAFREREKQLYSKNSKRDIVYSNIPRFDTKEIIVEHKQIIKEIEKKNEDEKRYTRSDLHAGYKKFKNESNKVVSYLVKEFELRKNAEQQSRAKVSKTGELNMSRIHEYKLTDDIFARITKVPNGKSHGLVIFIDWSGSMIDKIHATIKQLLNLVMFCKKVNIPFDVYAFTTQWKTSEYAQKPKVGDLAVTSQFSLLNLFNHKMSISDYTKMSTYLLDFGTGWRMNGTNLIMPEKLSLSGTPLNHTIVTAFELIPNFKKENNIDIVNAVFLTDGESSMIGTRYGYVDPHSKRIVVTTDARPNIYRRVIFRDPVTKACVEVVDGTNGGLSSSAASETVALLTLLKQRADCNLVGFYIANNRDMRNAFDLYLPLKFNTYSEKTQKLDEMMDVFRKEKTYVIESIGYDEYYFIATSSMDTDDDELIVNSTTTRGLVSAFSKYTGGKVNSRIILNRFIKMIA